MYSDPKTATPSAPDFNAEVCILLGLYQGETYLQAQLDSYAEQDHHNWSLLVSDDGSNDGSAALVERFLAEHPTHRIILQQGPAQGFARNFLSLLQAVPPDVPYAALSDQDDVWFSDKLTRALRQLQAVPENQPALYCARTMICDADLKPLGPSGLFQKPAAFRNALVQSIGGGNTMVLNRAALDLVAAAAAETTDPVAHDWWLYQIITGCGGRIIQDPDPVLLYRQHGGNIIGANLSVPARMTRIFALLGGRFRRWNDTGLAALSTSQHRFTPQASQAMTQFIQARSGRPWHRLAALRSSGVYRQSRLGNLALYVACLLGRL